MSSTSKKKYYRYEWTRWSDLRKLKNFVVLDTETTGISCEKEKIIEIAIAKVSDNLLISEFSSLVNPGKKLSSRITSLTGLTDSDLADAPTFREIAQQVVDFIGDSVILAHNAPFDLSFLCNALDECGIHANFAYLDTLQLAKKGYPQFENHKLETLISKLNLSEKQSHRAMDDVRCTLKLFQLTRDKYGSPLIDAIEPCCHPITDYRFTPREDPLYGLSFALVGTYTFSHSAIKKLISVAKGTVVDASDPSADYLVYGFIDPIESPPELGQLVETVKTRYKQGGKTKPINEVAFLKLCGVSFYDDETAYDQKEG